jgi:sulfide:quinone oxidoreductase
MKKKVVIVGGGTAGTTVAARLRKSSLRNKLDIVIIEPSEKHYYQPLWTLVGGGIVSKEASVRPEKDYIPEGVTWIKDSVIEFLPEKNAVVTKEGKTIEYDFMVVAPGIQIDWHKVKGLTEVIGKDGVCSNYSYETVDSTWQFIRNFKEGNAIFTQPNTPIKCGGAPQKICYLAEDYFRRNGIRNKANVKFITGTPSIFVSPHYANSLMKHCEEKGIETKFKYNLTELRPASKDAIFVNVETGEELIEHYDMIHVTPPMSAPDCIKQSTLRDEKGWCDVNKETLQHTRYENVFSLGDASNLPTSKTGAAIRKQAPILVNNLLKVIKGEKPAYPPTGILHVLLLPVMEI